jgi:hypothetical protein
VLPGELASPRSRCSWTEAGTSERFPTQRLPTRPLGSQPRVLNPLHDLVAEVVAEVAVFSLDLTIPDLSTAMGLLADNWRKTGRNMAGVHGSRTHLGTQWCAPTTVLKTVRTHKWADFSLCIQWHFRSLKCMLYPNFARHSATWCDQKAPAGRTPPRPDDMSCTQAQAVEAGAIVVNML